MLIKKLKLALLATVVADLIALISQYSSIEVGALNLGSSAYNIIHLILR
jgi:hypothetical protein